MSNGAPTLMTGDTPTAPAPVTADTATSQGTAAASDWGIYLKGAKVIDPDSVISLDYRREWTLADYQVEGGLFETYDKVARPFDVRVRISKGGDEAARRAFLDTVEAISGTLDLYDVITPEASYLQVNVVSLGTSRTATGGMGLIVIELGLRQVRTTAVAAFQAVASQSAADPVNGGTVQAQPVTKPATKAEIDAAVAEARANLDANMFTTPAF